MIFNLFCLLMCLLALLPALLIRSNLRYFRKAPALEAADSSRPISVLIPARNEQQSIEACLQHVLANENVNMEVIVFDDRSDDDTATIVTRIARQDARVRLHRSVSLPAGWCGKQYACHTLGNLARHDRLLWIDADVRLTPDALARINAYMDEANMPLVSGFPRQEAQSWAEMLVIPLIHLVLLGYMPLVHMRRDLNPALAVGCGQLMLADRAAYQDVGGHQAIQSSLHDGVMLPRVFRKNQHMTDVFDASDIASCRMYHCASAVWQGFVKNATEGMATHVGIWVWSILLLGGHVLPWLVALGLLAHPQPLSMPTACVLTGLACVLSATSSVIIWRWFKQPVLSLLLRPLAVAMLLAIQWYAYARKCVGLPVGWRGRRYAAA